MLTQALSFRNIFAAGWLMIAAACISLLLPAGSARADIVVTDVTTTTTYGYGFLGTSVVLSGASGSVRNADLVNGNTGSEYGVDFNSTAGTDAFYFLHNQYCVGDCSSFAMTTVTIALANNGSSGPGAEASRFDTELTPGHLARAGAGGPGQATFNFSVSETIAGNARTLYTAAGISSPTQTSITTSDNSVFNGLIHSVNGANWNVLDWSATNLNLLVDPIAVGETASLTYQLFTDTASGTPSCTDISNCPGLQVAFGDPRHNGGGVTNVSRAFASPLAPVIGGLYDAVLPPIAIVAPDAPLPPEPPVIPAVTYGAPFVSQVPAVPEPTSWLLMIVGFGCVGMTLRRRAVVRVLSKQSRRVGRGQI